MSVCMGGWVDERIDGWGSYQITKNLINLDLIEIIQFCLKIYDLWRYLYSCPTLWSQSLAIEIMNIIHM